MPWLHYVLTDNFILGLLKRPSVFSRTAAEIVGERMRNVAPKESEHQDLLIHFIKTKEKYPEVVTHRQIVIYAASNVAAGSLSVMGVLNTILKFLILDQSAQKRLRQELEDAKRNYPVSWQQSQALKYLGAVVKKGIRFDVPNNLLLERNVPESGLEMV